MSNVSIKHAVLFSKQELLRRQEACGSSNKSDYSWNDRKKKQLLVKFLFNAIFEYIHIINKYNKYIFLFKNTEK